MTLLLQLGTPSVISATLALSSAVPLHGYPLLLLAILEKICGAVAAAPLALQLLQVEPCDAWFYLEFRVIFVCFILSFEQCSRVLKPLLPPVATRMRPSAH